MKKAIQFGAGNIGRGFIGALLSNAGYEVIFADINKEVINALNRYREYTIHVMDTECVDEKITNIRGVLSNGEDILKEIESATVITTAVGPNVLKFIAPTIAEGIRIRNEKGVKEYLNIIACENAIKASSKLEELVLKELNDEERLYVDQYIGFPNCSVDRIVPPIKSDRILDVGVEKFYEWNVEEKAFKGVIPKIEGMNLVGNLMPYIERKLFTLNTGHAITAYIGYLKKYATIDQSINDSRIYEIVRNSMIESGNGLVEKYNFDKELHVKYIDKIINRFKNPYLKDDVLRVGREPLRKLSENDRLIKPLMTAKEYGEHVDNLIIGIAAALHYSNNEDKQSIEIQELIKSLGVKKTLKKISNINNNYILDEIDEAYRKIYIIIE